MSKSFVSKTLVIGLNIFLLMISINFAQTKSEVFDKVPIVERKSLQTRLEQFVTFHKTKQWEKVFDLFSTNYRNSSEVELTKEKFVKNKYFSNIKKFTPQAIQESPDGNGEWLIWGCASFDNGKSKAAVTAFHENGNWLFSDIWAVFSCVDCEPTKCKH